MQTVRSSPFAGAVFDLTGSYLVPFSVIIVFIVAALFLALWLQGRIADPGAATPGGAGR